MDAFAGGLFALAALGVAALSAIAAILAFDAGPRRRAAAAASQSRKVESVAGTLALDARGLGRLREDLAVLSLAAAGWRYAPGEFVDRAGRRVGIDALFAREAHDGAPLAILVAEVKGPDGTLSMTKTLGRQMSRRWLVSRLQEAWATRPEATRPSRIAAQALAWLEQDDPRLTAAVVRIDMARGQVWLTPVDAAGHETGNGEPVPGAARIIEAALARRIEGGETPGRLAPDWR